MEIQKKTIAQGTIISLSGEVDMHNAPELEKYLSELVSEKTPTIFINLSETTYLDSSAIATLVGCLKNVRSYEGFFGIIKLHEKIRPIFEIMRLEKVFSIFDTLDDALKAINGSN